MNGRTQRKYTFAPRLYASDVSVACRAALAGLGITLLPEILCVDDLAKKGLVQVMDGWEGERGGVHLLYRAHRSLTVAVRTCIERFLVELPGTDPSHAQPARDPSKERASLASRVSKSSSGV